MKTFLINLIIIDMILNKNYAVSQICLIETGADNSEHTMNFCNDKVAPNSTAHPPGS